MEGLNIRESSTSDLEDVYGLIKEPNEPSVSLDQFKRDFNTSYKCLVATHENAVVGIALYFWGYSTWKGKLLYLDDLVVKREFRKYGIG